MSRRRTESQRSKTDTSPISCDQLIDCEEDRTLRAVLVGMLREGRPDDSPFGNAGLQTPQATRKVAARGGPSGLLLTDRREADRFRSIASKRSGWVSVLALIVVAFVLALIVLVLALIVLVLAQLVLVLALIVVIFGLVAF